MATKYNSITETLQAQILTPAAISTFGTLPGQLIIPSADILDVSLAAVTPAGLDGGRFNIRDIPAINKVKIACSSAIAAPLAVGGSGGALPAFALELVPYTGNVPGVSVASTLFTIPVLNMYQEYDLYSAFNTSTSRAAIRAAEAGGADSLRINFVHDPIPSWYLDGYGAAAAWNAAELSLWCQAVVTHTFPVAPF